MVAYGIKKCTKEIPAKIKQFLKCTHQWFNGSRAVRIVLWLVRQPSNGTTEAIFNSKFFSTTEIPLYLLQIQLAIFTAKGAPKNYFWKQKDPHSYSIGIKKWLKDWTWKVKKWQTVYIFSTRIRFLRRLKGSGGYLINYNMPTNKQKWTPFSNLFTLYYIDQCCS